MAMVVACKFCRSWFRLNEALLKDAKAVRIRCGKCGGYIVIRNPEALPTFPDVAVGSNVEDRLAEGADLSDTIRSEPSSSDPGNPEKVDLPLPEFFAPPSAPDAGLDLSRHPAEESIVAPEETVEDSSARPSYASFRTLLMVIAGFSILLLALGTLYFGNREPGKKLLGKWFPSSGWKIPGNAAANPVYTIRDVKSHMEKGISGETLYILQGTVANIGKGPSQGILIQVTLLGKDNKARTNTAVFVGNLIDNTMLFHMNRGGMEGALGALDGQGRVNRDLPAGSSLPFMVVYFDPPDNNVKSILVKALDGNE